jgi:hypothetical protein
MDEWLLIEKQKVIKSGNPIFREKLYWLGAGPWVEGVDQHQMQYKFIGDVYEFQPMVVIEAFWDFNQSEIVDEDG